MSCQFCNGEFKIEDINDSNMDFFDKKENVEICLMHQKEILDVVAEGKI